MDAVDGYHAVPLHIDSRPLTNFITPFGAFRYKRLPQGFLASGDAYTRRYDELISHIPRKVKCIDDVLLWDNDIATSFDRAWDYLTFCAENGIVISKRKFKFCRDEVDFAGLKITKSGIAPSDKILKAILEYPTPTNITDARSWFGLVNQVTWAHSDTSSMEPFRDLIKPKTPFHWNDALEKIFQESKRLIVDQVKNGVKTFDTSKPTCLQTDWSKQGMGFLLLQKHCKCEVKNNPQCCASGWQLTYAGSRFTTEVESRYSPTEGEAAAVAWSLKKSRFFTLGCNTLFIATDHQPLLGLFKKELNNIVNPRLLRIREKTLMFSFDVVYISGKSNKGADAISRNPVKDNCDLAAITIIDEQINALPCSIITSLNDEDGYSTDYSYYTKLIEAIGSDGSYKKLQNLIIEGFPTLERDLDVELRRFWTVKDRLSQTENGVILMDERIVIPKNYRKTILELLHVAHQGVTTMKRRANKSVYWPGMNNDLNNIRENCKYCNEIARQHTKEPLILTPDPDFPFQEIAADFFVIQKHMYLVIVDRYSGWFTISYCKPNEATTSNVIKECINLFCTYGAPEVLSSDGGPQFKSEEFAVFLKDWNIQHRMSSAHYAQSNGRAEAAVKTAKRIIAKYVDKENPFNTTAIAHAIIQHRNTPLPDLQLSPAQILFHRHLRDKIPTHPKHLRLHKDWIMTAKQRELLFKAKNDASMNRYNTVSKNLTPLKPQTKVLVLTGNKNPRWNISGTVVMVLPFRKYRVKLDGSGRIVIRNRRFLRAYKHNTSQHNTSHTMEGTDVPEIIPHTSNGNPPAVEEDNIPHTSNGNPPAVEEENIPHTSNESPPTVEIERNLRPFNKPGFLEDTNDIPHRTTRSGAKYT